MGSIILCRIEHSAMATCGKMSEMITVFTNKKYERRDVDMARKDEVAQTIRQQSANILAPLATPPTNEISDLIAIFSFAFRVLRSLAISLKRLGKQT